MAIVVNKANAFTFF